MSKSVDAIQELLQFTTITKHKHALLARRIIGLSQQGNSFYEFDASGIQLKTIRVKANGKIREHMSFKQILYKDIVNEEWEDSTFYQELINKFIIVIFTRNNINEDYFLDKVKFWNMPQHHIDLA